MDLILRFTDRPRYEMRRLAAELAALYRSAAASGSGLESRFSGFSRGAAGARRIAKTSGSRLLDFLDALENSADRLEKAIADMALHGLKPAPEAAEALLYAGNGLRLLSEFLARPGNRALPAEAAASAASAVKALRLAADAARADSGGFIANLKFCTIYSDLEKAARAVGDCAEILARTA